MITKFKNIIANEKKLNFILIVIILLGVAPIVLLKIGHLTKDDYDLVTALLAIVTAALAAIGKFIAGKLKPNIIIEMLAKAYVDNFLKHITYYLRSNKNLGKLNCIFVLLPAKIGDSNEKFIRELKKTINTKPFNSEQADIPLLLEAEEDHRPVSKVERKDLEKVFYLDFPRNLISLVRFIETEAKNSDDSDKESLYFEYRNLFKNAIEVELGSDINFVCIISSLDEII